MDLLRFTTAGSVDDGKSTLIGRLLYDSHSVPDDQLAAITAASKARGEEDINLSYLTDGLAAERQQGITIDVAYRYFATQRRKFIIADVPGHIQYTRNMVTGASSSHAALILTDARKGVLEQTKRHAFLASLLRIPHLILCVNKMDLVGYDETAYQRIVDEFTQFASRLEVPNITCIPVSALLGDHVVDRSPRMPWYQGSPLLYTLETLYLGGAYNHIDCRFPVQQVLWNNASNGEEYRGYAGRVASGVFRPGDEVIALPAGFTTRIRDITALGEPTSEAYAPMSVAIRLEDELDISRGDMLAKPNNLPRIEQDLEAIVCWFSTTPLDLTKRYLIRHTTREARCLIKDLRYRIDVNTLHKQEGVNTLTANDIGRLSLRTSAPLFIDPYKQNRTTGAFILIDESTHSTVAAGMLL